MVEFRSKINATTKKHLSEEYNKVLVDKLPKCLNGLQITPFIRKAAGNPDALL